MKYQVSRVQWPLNVRWAVKRGDDTIAYFSSKAAAKRDAERREALAKAMKGRTA